MSFLIRRVTAIDHAVLLYLRRVCTIDREFGLANCNLDCAKSFSIFDFDDSSFDWQPVVTKLLPYFTSSLTSVLKYTSPSELLLHLISIHPLSIRLVPASQTQLQLLGMESKKKACLVLSGFCLIWLVLGLFIGFLIGDRLSYIKVNSVKS